MGVVVPETASHLRYNTFKDKAYFLAPGFGTRFDTRNFSDCREAPTGRIKMMWLYHVVDRFEGSEAARALIDETVGIA
jgi:hypothetical protein